MPETGSVFAERVMGGNYIEFNINRDEIARYGLRIGDVQDVLEVALGGMPLTTTVEGLERYTVNLRYDRDFRENLEALREIVVPTPTGAQVPLGQLAEIEVVRAPMGIKSEGAVPNAWIYVDVKNIDIGTYVQMAQRAVNEAIARGNIQLPSGYSIFWSGQYEYMLRAKQRLMIVVPLTLLIIVLIIYLNTRSRDQDGHRDARGPVLAGGRLLDPLSARLQPQRRRLGRHHRPRRPGRRDRRRHAALPRPGLRSSGAGRPDAHRRRICATPSITAPSSASAPRP